MPKKRVKLILDFASFEPPTEFRIFEKGINRTSKGAFLFDDAAAESVMAAFNQAGVDGMIDLEHLSLDSADPNYTPDARGWYQLELRAGALWAVAVKWTPDGARRLAEKTQRYISPTFYVDEHDRITELYNVAICAIPATYEAPALVAASKRLGKKLQTLSVEVSKMDELKEIAKKLGLAEDAKLEDILKAIEALQDDSDDSSEDDSEELSDDGDESDVEKLSKVLGKAPKLQARVVAALTSKGALEKRVKDLEIRQNNDERSTLIAANASKLPKELDKWAKTCPLVALREFFAAAPAVEKTPSAEPVKQPIGETELTAEDRKMAKLTNTKPEVFLAHKKKMAEERAEKIAERQQNA